MSGYTFETGNSIMNRCLAEISGSEIAESSARTYASSLSKLSRCLDENDLTVYEADLGDINSFLRKQADQGLLASTIAGDKAATKKLYTHICLETDHGIELQLALIDELGNFATPPPLDQDILSKDELEKLFEAATNRRNRLLFVVGGETGGRNDSLRIIKLGDVDLEENEITLQNTKTGGSYVVPISDSLGLELDRWIAKERAEFTEVSTSNYLFPGKRSERLSTNQSFRDIVHQAAIEAGIQEVIFEREPTEAEQRAGCAGEKRQYYRVTPHTLRRTFSYLLEEAGLSTEQRRDALDHKSIKTTEKHYTFTNSDYRQKIRKNLHV